MTLTRFGFKDKPLQDEILLFVDEQEKARDKVRQAGSKVYKALDPQGVPTDAASMETLLNNYLIAVEDAKVEQEQATKAFEIKMGLDSKPHLRAALLVSGVVGEASFLSGDIILMGTMGMSIMARDVAARP